MKPLVKTRASLTVVSENRKLGPIPSSVTHAASCPPTCGLYNECYAKSGPTSIHWNAVSRGDRGLGWYDFCRMVGELDAFQFWRHNVAGDLPGNGIRIHAGELKTLLRYNGSKRGFTYTHYPLTKHNVRWIEYANAHGFTVNISCDSLAEVDEKAKTVRAPLVVVLPSDTVAKSLRTPEGRKVVVCHAPANGVTCDTCRICQNRSPNRAVIGFPAHGTKKSVIDIKLKRS